MQAAGAIVDLGEHQDRDGLVHRLSDLFGRDYFQLVAAVEGSDHALRDVEIGREIAAVGEVRLAGPANRSAAFNAL